MPALTRIRRAPLQALVPLLASALLPSPSAESEPARPLQSAPLAIVIAAQGDQALQQILEESRQSLRGLSLPSLAQAPGAGFDAAGAVSQ